MRKVLVAGVAAAATLAFAGVGLTPAGAGQTGQAAPLTIEKEVEGLVPPDTEFTIKVECEGEKNERIIVTGDGLTESVSLDFDEEGDADGTDTIFFDGPGTCTVTETESGGATSVSYECDGEAHLLKSGVAVAPTAWGDVAAAEDGNGNGEVVDPCDDEGPQADPMEVEIIEPRQEATVTVTNTFDPVPEPVVVEPKFTG